jgi:hypothetical protein
VCMLTPFWEAALFFACCSQSLCAQCSSEVSGSHHSSASLLPICLCLGFCSSFAPFLLLWGLIDYFSMCHCILSPGLLTQPSLGLVMLNLFVSAALQESTPPQLSGTLVLLRLQLCLSQDPVPWKNKDNGGLVS